MHKLLLATALGALAAGSSSAEEIKLGIIFGFTGPIESLTPSMAAAAEAAMKEVSDSGKLMGGATVTSVRADSTCTDAAVATAAAEKMITADKVAGIVGADCSGVTTAVLQNVAMPNGMVMISPSATSPALTDLEDNGLFFRTAPSDAREGQIMTDILMEKGLKSVALTYTNNDYGKGLADAFTTAYEAAGGKITISAAHEDGLFLAMMQKRAAEPSCRSALKHHPVAELYRRVFCDQQGVSVPVKRQHGVAADADGDQRFGVWQSGGHFHLQIAPL
jgi:branched-chain amino acid transport system substrate-binding protein